MLSSSYQRGVLSSHADAFMKPEQASWIAAVSQTADFGYHQLENAFRFLLHELRYDLDTLVSVVKDTVVDVC